MEFPSRILRINGNVGANEKRFPKGNALAARARRYTAAAFRGLNLFAFSLSLGFFVYIHIYIYIYIYMPWQPFTLYIYRGDAKKESKSVYGE